MFDAVTPHLPLIFMFLMAVAMFFYVVLDGYDLGVGMLMGWVSNREDRNRMVASIGPFWDANETWLVLGVGILLVAFPRAHGVILSTLYLPVFLMLLGLILRGVAFDFRTKAHAKDHLFWDRVFITGSFIASMAQGFMLGLYVLGFEINTQNFLFAVLSALGLVACYLLIGASWLIMKTEGELQRLSVLWAKRVWLFVVLGLIAVSVATPLLSRRIFSRWFDWPNFFILLPIPLLTGLVLLGIRNVLETLPAPGDRRAHWPFVGMVLVQALGFLGLAYSFYPYIVPERMTVWEAASGSGSLWIILCGTLVVLPMILGYTIYAYRVFWGKVRELRYD